MDNKPAMEMKKHHKNAQLIHNEAEEEENI